nr:unnamed protein product [Digitaria exilis]
MDSGRNDMISSAVPFRAAGEGGGQVFLFGGGGFLRGAPLARADAAADGGRKRPFQLTAHEELQLQLELGDDYELHDGGPPQERTKRRLTAEQVRELELSFEEEKRKLEPERKSELARRLGIPPRQVAVWFMNRRARWKAKQLEQDFDRLRAAHDELLAGRDALMADNDRLRSLVITLTEELQAKESSAPELDKQTAALQTGAYAYSPFEQDQLRIETAGGGAVPAVGSDMGGASDSLESYLAGARSPPSSSEDDYGGGDGYAFFLPVPHPDALLDMAVEFAAEGDGDVCSAQ